MGVSWDWPTHHLVRLKSVGSVSCLQGGQLNMRMAVSLLLGMLSMTWRVIAGALGQIHGHRGVHHLLL